MVIYEKKFLDRNKLNLSQKSLEAAILIKKFSFPMSYQKKMWAVTIIIKKF